MKNLFKSAALLFCLGLMASCSKNNTLVPSDPVVINPISDYTITKDANDAFTYHFASLAKDFTKLEWRFGDDTLVTDTNPTHTYLTTGTYLVDLEAYSKTGAFSHNEVGVNIIPDSVMTLNAVKTGVTGQLKFSAAVKANIKSILWSFNVIDPVTSTTTVVTSTDVSPVVTFPFGSFDNFTVSVVTDKNSTVSLARSCTPDGIAIDITATNIGYKSTYEDDGNSNENSPKLIDGNTQTKFGYYSAFPGEEDYDVYFPAPVIVKTYGLENGNDSESTRDPKEWYIKGSNDKGVTWDVLDHQNLTIGFADYLTSIGQSATRYFRFFYYPIATPGSYSWYRWAIISTFDGAFQMMELRYYK